MSEPRPSNGPARLRLPVGPSLGLGWLPAFGVLVAAAIGAFATELVPLGVALIALLPVAAHVRWCGLKRALSEPNVATIVLYFYLLVFPLRALVVWASDFGDVIFGAGTITSHELVIVLVTASVGTTGFIESYHRIRRLDSVARTHHIRDVDRVHLLAGGAVGAVLLSLVVIVLQKHGIAGAQAAFQSHRKLDTVESAASGPAEHLWFVASVPAVWLAACGVMSDSIRPAARWTYIVVAATVIGAELYIFGSRLRAVEELMGIWIVLYLAGRPVGRKLLVVVPVLVILSVPILSARPGGLTEGLSTTEQYSRITGYGVLDASLALIHDPGAIKQRVLRADRWLDLPLYLVPSAVWPGKPKLAGDTLDLYVAKQLLGPGREDTGIPISYITEFSIYGGWPVVLLFSILLGGLIGWIDRALWATRARAGIGVANVLLYCLLAQAALTMFKDGDVVATTVGQLRLAIYLAVGMWICGVWGREPIGRQLRSARS